MCDKFHDVKMIADKSNDLTKTIFIFILFHSKSQLKMHVYDVNDVQCTLFVVSISLYNSSCSGASSAALLDAILQAAGVSIL